MGSLLTVTEYRNAPTAVDTVHLVSGGNQAAQDAELANVIRRASSWCEDQCDQPLIAARWTDYTQARIGRDGCVRVHPKRNPLNQIVSISYGSDAANLYDGTVTGAWVDHDEMAVIPASAGITSLNPITTLSAPSGRLLAKLVYVSAWPNALLTVQANAGVSALTVASGEGFTPSAGSKLVGTEIVVIDGANTETVTVASVAGNVLTLGAATVYAHAVGVPVSGVPGTVKEAAVKATTAFIRGNRGGGALVLGQAQPGTPVADDEVATRALRDAYFLLKGYRRIR